jgi:hypothetical protein
MRARTPAKRKSLVFVRFQKADERARPPLRHERAHIIQIKRQHEFKHSFQFNKKKVINEQEVNSKPPLFYPPDAASLPTQHIQWEVSPQYGHTHLQPSIG